jgi:hypothetical protein
MRAHAHCAAAQHHRGLAPPMPAILRSMPAAGGGACAAGRRSARARATLRGARATDGSAKKYRSQFFAPHRLRSFMSQATPVRRDERARAELDFVGQCQRCFFAPSASPRKSSDEGAFIIPQHSPRSCRRALPDSRAARLRSSGADAYKVRCARAPIARAARRGATCACARASRGRTAKAPCGSCHVRAGPQPRAAAPHDATAPPRRLYCSCARVCTLAGPGPARRGVGGVLRRLSGAATEGSWCGPGGAPRPAAAGTQRGRVPPLRAGPARAARTHARCRGPVRQT